MRHSRAGHTATLLASGRALITGGGQAPNLTASCDLYDFATHQMVNPPPPDMSQTRSNAFAATVDDGRAVLVTGGYDLDQDPANPPGRKTAELYLAAEGRWVNVPDMPAPHAYHSGVNLSDDIVMVMGGTDANGFQNEADIFTFLPFPPFGFWCTAGTFSAFGKTAPAVLLPNHAVLFGSGVAGTAPYGTFSDGAFTTEADLYDPWTHAWKQSVPQAVAHQDGAAISVSYQGAATTIVFGGSSSGSDITNVTNDAAVHGRQRAALLDDDDGDVDLPAQRLHELGRLGVHARARHLGAGVRHRDADRALVPREDVSIHVPDLLDMRQLPGPAIIQDGEVVPARREHHVVGEQDDRRKTAHAGLQHTPVDLAYAVA
jgi:hypothetical protein